METTPLKRSVKAQGHTAQYKMHKYFARRPYNVFRHIIRHYTEKGDVVLDSFCGGGVTVFEAAALERRVIGVDLNPLAAFITKMQMFHGDTAELKDFYRRFLVTAEKKYGDWYRVVFPDDEGTALWFEWAYIVRCPACGERIVLTEENKKSNGIYFCSNAACQNRRKGVKRVDCIPAGSKPLRVKYRSSTTGKTLVRPLTTENMPVFEKYDFQEIVEKLPRKAQFTIPDDWDRLYEDKLREKGIHEYSDFFTERNYALNCLLFQDILSLRETTDERMNEYLYFLFSSSLRYTNKMTRVTDNWENGKPTAMDKHAFWLPNQYVETNILDVLRQRSKAILQGCEYAASTLPSDLTEALTFEELNRHNHCFMVLNRSSSELPIPEESVDVIITDPPYGSNVQYAELSTVWNAWYARYRGLDSYIYKKDEAVANRKKNFANAKSIDDYEELLYRVYREGNRVLKPGGYLVFTFHNKNIKVWIAMLRAVARAGFYLPDDGILFQDYIESYKNTAHLRFSGNVQGDFIYSFRKGNMDVTPDGSRSFSKIIDDTIDNTARFLKRGKTYNTPELYQKILTSMTKELMAYILWCTNNHMKMEDISSFSNDYLESRLKATLVCENGIWYRP